LKDCAEAGASAAQPSAVTDETNAAGHFRAGVSTGIWDGRCGFDTVSAAALTLHDGGPLATIMVDDGNHSHTAICP
jgi:hypothetical protein